MNQSTGKPSSVMNKRIPTLVGLGVLVVGLIVGIVLLGTGTNVFAPRATPETTPKQIRITNVSDTSFSVSFATDESTAGFLKYGTEEKKITTQSPDDRDKLTGSVASFTLHHVTVSGLQPNTQYYYLLGTGGGTTFDNNGSAFMIKTTAKGGTPSAAKTAYGSVSTEAGSPADGAVVYINMEGIGELSALVKSSGSWAIPLSNARLKTDGTYAQITDETPISIEIKGTDPRQQVKYQTSIGKSQPVSALQFGKSPETAEVATVEKPATVEMASGSAEQADPTTKTQGGIKNLLDGDSDPGLTATETDPIWYGADSTASATLDLENDKHQLINSDQPIISGTVPPNVEVTIEIHSETEITQQLISNPDGTFSLNIEELGKQLEPGEHTVTYSYEDPNTGELVTKTQTFTVKPKSGGSNQLALAPTPTPTPTATPKASPSPSPTPFGSGNPYPVGGSGSATKSATASSSASATRSAQVATGAAMPVSGSIGTTMTLIIGGLFFLLAGGWSFWISREYVRQEE